MQGENPVHWLPPGPQSDSAVELPAWYLGCQSRRAARQEGDPGSCRKCDSGLPPSCSQIRLHGGLTSAVQEGSRRVCFNLDITKGWGL